MIIKGLQKLSTIDYPGRLACTLFLFGCNFRCGFCHNPGLVIKNEGSDISLMDVLAFLRARRGFLDGVCFSGGEPLASLDISFVRLVKELGFLVKVDTNGSFPDKLRLLVDEGLVDFVAMDIKTTKDEYVSLVGDVDVKKLEETMWLMTKVKDFEFRTTIIPGVHSREKLRSMIDWVRGVTGLEWLPRFSLQGFVPRLGMMVSSAFDATKSADASWVNSLAESLCSYADVQVKV